MKEKTGQLGILLAFLAASTLAVAAQEKGIDQRIDEAFQPVDVLLSGYGCKCLT